MRALTVAALALAAAGAATVASGSDGPAPAGKPGAVEKTVRTAVYAAVRHHNYRRACRFGTPRGRQRLLEGFNSSSGPDYPDCPTLIADLVETYPYTMRKLRRGLVIDVIRIRNGRATVRVAEGSGPFDGDGRLSLVKAGGAWRLDDSSLIPYGD